MVRINSRLNTNAPLRNKTMNGPGITTSGDEGPTEDTPSGGAVGSISGGSGRGGVHGGATPSNEVTGSGGGGSDTRIPGVKKSRAIDLTHHLIPTLDSTNTPPGSGSQLGHQQCQHERRLEVTRQKNWSEIDNEAREKEEGQGVWSAVQGGKNRGRGGEGEGNTGGTEGGSLPPLSPRSTLEANSGRIRCSSSRGLSPHSQRDITREFRGSSDLHRHGGRREEQKTPRASAEFSTGGCSPRLSSSIKPSVCPTSFGNDCGGREEVVRGGWSGWDQGKERDEENERRGSLRLPSSRRGSSPREKAGGGEEGRVKLKPSTSRPSFGGSGAGGGRKGVVTPLLHHVG